MFNKILIANRGEIACRVILTARRMGIRTVAVFSEADAKSRHVSLADEAIGIGPASARESYLVADRLIDAAKLTGAQAIHPGYGFLSENDQFASACAKAGIVFVGPPVDAIRAMGLKAESKTLMEKAGVPLTPGYHGADQSPALLREQAQKIGYPVLIKASAGGGGKGMRLVEEDDQFDSSLESCRREASASFGNDDVLVEKFIQRPRHIEIQVFGDTQGNVVHLFERDCSVQRRHQKVLEEAPAPGMTPERRTAMGKAAVEAAKAVGYVGAGTVEFIVGPEGDFYFMEMNTRLQVEHPVTEMITGLDLVQWQLLVAAGQPLPLAQADIKIVGHAIEARVYAEDPTRKFLPSTGLLTHLRFPNEVDGVRVDTGVREGDAISPYYDPMIAKVIAHGSDRDSALAKLSMALYQTQVVGVRSNVRFLGQLLSTDSFRTANLDTALIERESWALTEKPTLARRQTALFIAAISEVFSEQRSFRARSASNPWDIGDAWRLNGAATRIINLILNAEPYAVQVDYLSQGARLTLGDTQCVARVRELPDHRRCIELNSEQHEVRVVDQGRERHLFTNDWREIVEVVDPLAISETDDDVVGGMVAPMPGKVIALSVATGSRVAQGDALLVMEAMKMEHTIVAPESGTVTAFRYAVGDQVQEGAELVAFDADSSAEGE